MRHAFDAISLREEAYKKGFASYLSPNAASGCIPAVRIKCQFNNKIAAITGDLHRKFYVPKFTFWDIEDENIRNFYNETIQNLNFKITLYLWDKSYDQENFAKNFFAFADERLEEYRLLFEEHLKQKNLEQKKRQEIMNCFERSLHDMRGMVTEVAEKMQGKRNLQ